MQEEVSLRFMISENHALLINKLLTSGKLNKFNFEILTSSTRPILMSTKDPKLSINNTSRFNLSIPLRIGKALNQ